MGFEPMNTGFAESKYPAFLGTYGNPSVLKSTEKDAWQPTQWVENGLEMFLGKHHQYSRPRRHGTALFQFVRCDEGSARPPHVAIAFEHGYPCHLSIGLELAGRAPSP
jgi:hypothetical protein